jgi:hypothetical protein
MSRPAEPIVPDPIWPGVRPKTRPRGVGQRVSLVAAYLSYFTALICLGAIGFWVSDAGIGHPVVASLGASAVFFVGAGVVLHVMALANLPSLRFGREDDEPPRL